MKIFTLVQAMALTLVPAFASMPTTVPSAHAGDAYRNVDHSYPRTAQTPPSYALR